jgi:chromosome segregation ATPase
LFSWQSLLLSKALKLQQKDEDKKNELVVNNLEKRVKELENSLAEKNSKIKNAETNLTEAQLRIIDQVTRIRDEIAHSKLKEAKNHYEHEVRSLKNKIEAESENSSKLSEALMSLRETCSSFVARSSIRPREIFNSFGVVSGKRIILLKTFQRPSISWRRKLMNLTK